MALPAGASGSTTDARSFAGEERFAASADRTFTALTDPDILAKCIPDLVSAQRVDDRTLRCVVKPGFSFIRAQLKMTVAVCDIDAGRRHAAIEIVSKGIGTSMSLRCVIAVAPGDTNGSADSSRVQWNAAITQVSGLMAAVSPTLIRGAADKVIHDGWSALRLVIETS